MPVLDGPAPLTPVLNFGDLIEKTERYLASSQRDMAVQLSTGAQPRDEVLNVSGVAAQGIAIGAVLAIDLEVFYVLGVNISNGTGTVNVVPGYFGSEPAVHISGTLVYIDPHFTRFDIAQAINDDLADLSSPTNSLYAVLSASITYNPAFQGYDLGTAGVPADFIDVLELRYQIPTPTRNFPLMPGGKYSVARNIASSYFPSGYGIIIYESAYPGLPMFITYAYPFAPLRQLSDPVVSTTGLPPSAVDIPPLGAACRLVETREVKRNFIESQPDARKAQETPPGAVLNSMKGLALRRSMRIDAEADRLRRQYPRQRSY